MAPSSSQDMTLNGLNEFMGEDESDDGVSNVSAHIHDMAIDNHSYLPQTETSASGKDDVPDLSYDDAIGSSLMMPSKSLESMAASSRQDEDEELASPPFEALHLPPTDESDKLGRSVSQGILGYDSHGLPASSSIRLI